MKPRSKFILSGVLLALVIFPLWRFAFQSAYLTFVGWIVAAFGNILPYGKAGLSKLIEADSGEIAFDLFDFRRTVVVDVSSIVTNIVPMVALVLATPIEWKKRMMGALIAIGIAFLSHIFAAAIILWWQARADTGVIEGLKIFTDGILIAALPLLYWFVWADSVQKDCINELLKSKITRKA